MSHQNQDLLAEALARCASEQIHLAGAIQNHGTLLAIDDAGILRMASDNLQAVFGQAAASVLDRPVTGLIGEDALIKLRNYLSGNDSEYVTPLRLSVFSGGREIALVATAHRADRLMVVELEQAGQDSQSAQVSVTEMAMRLKRLDRYNDIDSYCQAVVEQLHRLTGFDRVMVYRFDHRWNGEIIAECRSDDLPSFLHHHFPASDIPPQARVLYEKNLLRFLADTDAPTVPLISGLNAMFRKPLDLSFSVLRAVSPVHLEYLRNMGVRATVTISLLNEGKLWGMITCHHAQPRRISFELRNVIALMGSFFSMKISSLFNLARIRSMDTIRGKLQELTDLLRHTNDIDALFQERSNEFLNLAGATGSYFVFENNQFTAGRIPPESELPALIDWIKRQELADGVFVTDNLGALYPQARAFAGDAAGLLAVALDYQKSSFILWFRSEAICNIPWAGNPHKQITADEHGPRLTPRHSFAVWLETARGFSAPWLDNDIVTVKLFSFSIVQLLIQQARRRAEMADLANRAKSEFLSGMSHELRTPMNAILGFSQLMEFDQSLAPEHKRGVREIRKAGDHLLALIDEVLDLAKVESGHVSLSPEPVDLPALIGECLVMTQPMAHNRGLHISHACRHGLCVRADRMRLKQILLNLISNAIKYNRDGGAIRIEAQPECDDRVRISVSDTGHGIAEERKAGLFQPFNRLGAENSAIEGTGLGLTITRRVTELMGGTIGVASEMGVGSTFWIELPGAAPLPPHASPAIPVDGDLRRKDIPDIQRTVLYIEDNPANLKLMAHILSKRTYTRLLTAHATALGIELAQAHRPDLILMDINMPGMDGYRALKLLKADPQLNNIPVVAVSANAMEADIARSKVAGFSDYIVKPIDVRQLLNTINRYLIDSSAG